MQEQVKATFLVNAAVLNCIYTAGNENVCRKYRKMAEMLHAALHFAVKSSKV